MSAQLSDGDKLGYAWNWFSYHARQRLICFHFFIVILGGVGYLFATNPHPMVFLIGGIFLIWVTQLFYTLEVRNRELVNCGREVLEELIPDEKENPRIKDKKRSLFEETLKDCRLPKSIKRTSQNEIKHGYVYNQVYKWMQRGGWIFVIIAIIKFLITDLNKINTFLCEILKCK